MMTLKRIEISTKDSNGHIVGERLLVTFYDRFVLFAHDEEDSTFSIMNDHLRKVVDEMQNEPNPAQP